jgi:hypothetical protein
MPSYTLEHKDTGEQKDVLMSYDELQQYLIDNLDWFRVIGPPPALVTQTGNTINRTSGDWKDLMKQIKKGSGSGNTIKT